MNLAVEIKPPMAAVYRGQMRGIRISGSERFVALSLSASCLAVLLIAAWLKPSAGGFGTHRQMGLAPCGFLERTGLPCPACGMTTSFSWLAHGHPLASFYVQPMGCLLAVICAMTFWAGLYIGVTGRPVHRVFRVVPQSYYLTPIFVIAILAWGWKMYIHLHGIDGWAS